MNPVLLADILDAARSLHPGDTLSPQVLAAIVRHVGTDGIRHSVETGCGGSTLLLSHLSEDHTVFAIEDENRTISRVRRSLLFRPDSTTFIEGPAQQTLPSHQFQSPIHLALIDGPHGFPFPQLEYYFIYPHLGGEALLIIDIHIPSINDLFRFLRVDDMFSLIEVVERTAFFRRTAAPVFDPTGDGWWLQNHNSKRLLRFTWRESLQNSTPVSFIKATLQRERKPAAARKRVCKNQYRIELDRPADSAIVGAISIVEGRAVIPDGVFLWLFARRADMQGWWPQGDSAIEISQGEWRQSCKFGEPHDQGKTFEIAIVAVDTDADRRLQRWLTEGRVSGEYPPVQLPVPISGLGPIRRTVIKNS